LRRQRTIEEAMRAWQTERKSGQRHAIGAFGVGLAPSASESPPEGRGFELKPGSIPVAGDCGDRNSMVRAYCREPPALFFAANTASACWYFCWYRQQSTMKTISYSNSYGNERLSARGTKACGSLLPRPVKATSHSTPNSLIRGVSILSGSAVNSRLGSVSSLTLNSRLGSVSSLTLSSTARNS
jgi:hypothetical protein